MIGHSQLYTWWIRFKVAMVLDYSDTSYCWTTTMIRNELNLFSKLRWVYLLYVGTLPVTCSVFFVLVCTNRCNRVQSALIERIVGETRPHQSASAAATTTIQSNRQKVAFHYRFGARSFVCPSNAICVYHCNGSTWLSGLRGHVDIRSTLCVCVCVCWCTSFQCYPFCHIAVLWWGKTSKIDYCKHTLTHRGIHTWNTANTLRVDCQNWVQPNYWLACDICSLHNRSILFFCCILPVNIQFNSIQFIQCILQ